LSDERCKGECFKDFMAVSSFNLREDYWDTFSVEDEDIEFIYNYLLEKETPLTSIELIAALVGERVSRERQKIERQRSAKGAIYLPKEIYAVDQPLVFPALGWRNGRVQDVRPGYNPESGEFQVIQVKFESGEMREFAANLPNHLLNNPVEAVEEGGNLDLDSVLAQYRDDLEYELEKSLENKPDFVRIAGRWFPRGLVVDINTGHLNLAEAILDMASGGPLPTEDLLDQVGLATADNKNLTIFSLDLAFQEDPRFDEVGPAGEVLWFLNRLEPEDVLKAPATLRYQEIEHDRSLLTKDMLALEKQLDDELSPLAARRDESDEAQFPIIFPHWRAGTLPLSAKVRHLFPTAYEAPRIRFTLEDGDTGEKFPGWIVREQKYVYGLREWFESKGVIPGSLICVQRGKKPGEVIVRCNLQRPAREWIRTVLVGSDGGIVFAMLKQTISTLFDERMTVFVPDVASVDQVWQNLQRNRLPFERSLVNIVRELSKLTPQSHVHASELYSALNITRRAPPAPIFAMLSSRPWFVHVGDNHFRFDDSERG
jgi:hypothetical protein